MEVVFEFSENGTNNKEDVSTYERLREITQGYAIEVNETIGVDHNRMSITKIVVETLAFIEGDPSVQVFVNYERNS